MAAYYYKGKTVPRGVGMPGWSEMTITEGILAKCAPPLYPLFPSDRAYTGAQSLECDVVPPSTTFYRVKFCGGKALKEGKEKIRL